MKLYTEYKDQKFTEVFELNSEMKINKILYMAENSKIIQRMVQSIKKNKLITFKNNKIISGIESSGLLKSIKYNDKTESKYNLIIFCTGNNSHLVKTFF